MFDAGTEYVKLIPMSNAAKVHKVKINPGTVEWIALEWAVKIATLKTGLAKLELLGSLRDPHTGIYVHHGMATAVGNSTHEVLLSSHNSVFDKWLALSFPEQMQDLQLFIAAVTLPDGSRKRVNQKGKSELVLHTWSELEPYRNFVPLSASKLDRDLFLVNLTTMITLLKSQLKGSRNTIGGD